MTTRPIALLLVCFLLAGAAIAPVLAKDATVGVTSLTLPPPNGACDLDATEPSDARMLKAVEGSCALLATACWR